MSVTMTAPGALHGLARAMLPIAPSSIAVTGSSTTSRSAAPLRAVTPELHSYHAPLSWRVGNYPEFVLPMRRRSTNQYYRRGYVSVAASVDAAMLAMEGQKDLEVGHGVGNVVAEVRAAYNSGHTRSPTWRAQQLTGIMRMVGEREEEILDALFADLGKSSHEAFVTEISLIRSSCKQAINELKQWMAPVKVCGSVTTFPSSAAIVAEPLGVTLVISAWNFPFLLSVDPMIGAIAAGCAMVLKPSEVAPATSALLAKLVPLYLDSSVIRVVEGGVEEAMALLEQKWDKIFYTGSAKVGRVVLAAASKHLTPVTLELGGKCPVYFDRSANLKVGLMRIAQGKWGSNNGQACIAPDYILVDENVASELVDTLKDIIVEFYGKDPKISKDLSRIVNAFHYSRLTNLLDDHRISTNIVHGGERDENKLYIAPTLVCDVPLDTPLMLEEIFGPILPIIKVKGEQEAIDIINARAKPLAAYVFTSKKEVEERMVASISSGGMVVNDTVLHFVIHGLPFGGVGESGMGSYHGKFSFDAFSHKKAVLYRNSLGDVPARYPPFTEKKQSFVRCVLEGNYIGAFLSLVGLK